MLQKQIVLQQRETHIYTKNRVWFVNQTRYTEKKGKEPSIYRLP
jgi:hypothetical protein